jgi:hypothetical protein
MLKSAFSDQYILRYSKYIVFQTAQITKREQ